MRHMHARTWHNLRLVLAGTLLIPALVSHVQEASIDVATLDAAPVADGP